MYEYSDYVKAAQTVEDRLSGKLPELLMILGSGLGFIGDCLSDPVEIPYTKIPGFCKSTAPGHKGVLLYGTLQGKTVLIMQGRMHRYEGYTVEQIGFPVRVAKLLGVHSMVVTNAAGALNTDFQIGDLMLISDFINFTQASPLVGPNLPEFGKRFFDVGNMFTAEYRKLAQEIGRELGLPLREGTYVQHIGPQFESHAEIRAYRMLGGDAVGMSTVPECLTGAHCGMKILGVSLMCNYAAGLSKTPVTEEEVLESCQRAKPYFSELVLTFVNRLR